jgi:hypothetical protein
MSWSILNKEGTDNSWGIGCTIEPPTGAGLAHGGISSFKRVFPMKIELSDKIMGVETPIPPITIYAAAPDGAPPRRINDGYY